MGTLPPRDEVASGPPQAPRRLAEPEIHGDVGPAPAHVRDAHASGEDAPEAHRGSKAVSDPLVGVADLPAGDHVGHVRRVLLRVVAVDLDEPALALLLRLLSSLAAAPLREDPGLFLPGQRLKEDLVSRLGVAEALALDLLAKFGHLGRGHELAQPGLGDGFPRWRHINGGS